VGELEKKRRKKKTQRREGERRHRRQICRRAIRSINLIASTNKGVGGLGNSNPQDWFAKQEAKKEV